MSQYWQQANMRPYLAYVCFYLFILAIMSLDLVTKLTFVVSVRIQIVSGLCLYMLSTWHSVKNRVDSLYAFSGLCVGSMPVNR